MIWTVTRIFTEWREEFPRKLVEFTRPDGETTVHLRDSYPEANVGDHYVFQDDWLVPYVLEGDCFVPFIKTVIEVEL